MQAEQDGESEEELKNTGPLGKIWSIGPWKLEKREEKGVVCNDLKISPAFLMPFSQSTD